MKDALGYFLAFIFQAGVLIDFFSTIKANPVLVTSQSLNV